MEGPYLGSERRAPPCSVVRVVKSATVKPVTRQNSGGFLTLGLFLGVSDRP
jgi:hypothetical protein